MKMERRLGEGVNEKKNPGPIQSLLAHAISPEHKVASAILTSDVNRAAKTSIHFRAVSLKKHSTQKALQAVPFALCSDRGIGLSTNRHH